jgi:type II secretory pathway component PulF
MHQFTVVLQDRKGGPYRIQRMAATSPMDLLLNLLERKQAVVAVLDKRKLAPLARKRIKPLDRVYFFEQLESSCSLGFDPARAMEIAQITTATKTTGLLPWVRSENPLKRIAGDMLKRLQQGQSLGEAASQYPNLFDKVAMGLVDAGEHSGSLAETFGSIRQLTGRDEKVRDKLISISVYPAIVLAIAAIVIYQLATGPLPPVRASSRIDERRFALAVAADYRDRAIHWSLSDSVCDFYREPPLHPNLPPRFDQADASAS